ncbi:hypothetical protein JOQ06_012998 [Pogonophryne albipinna]|uniref:Uncharacterized protein n=1 Tax=Pogonophryne albipinna TaxID=1090488 RepID=A0AAD6BJ32_9TELE|nr:hypothetical protein JOQ06_012998 [Pogonophryne albipinna]
MNKDPCRKRVASSVGLPVYRGGVWCGSEMLQPRKFSVTVGMATDTYLVNDDPSRGPGMPECFLVSDTYRAASTTCLTHLAC